MHSEKCAVDISPELVVLFKTSPSYTKSIHPLFRWNGSTEPKYTDLTWDWYSSTYVKLPLSSCYTKKRIYDGKEESICKWEIITLELTKLKSLFGGEENEIGKLVKSAVATYNSGATRNMDFGILDAPELRKQLISTIPLIVDHVALLRDQLAKPIPILVSGKRSSIYVTQKLACSILANSFFCTFPNQNEKLPSINFNSLYQDSSSFKLSKEVKIEKLKCILNYFKQMKRKHIDDNCIISYERRQLLGEVNWTKSTETLSLVKAHVEGRIEDDRESLQVDFANRKIGGGILGDGMVQEEMRFAICPELIVARLFTEELQKDEVLVITGCEQFSKYSGYSTSFKFVGGYTDSQQIDTFGRRTTEIVAMDAYCFKPDEILKQYEEVLVTRELNKCYCAFYGGKTAGGVRPVATGNWGCGAFNGNIELKFLIQWMAASQAKRELHFYTFEDKSQYESIISLYTLLKESNITVGDLYKAIAEYKNEINRPYRNEHKSLFDFVKSYCHTKELLVTTGV